MQRMSIAKQDILGLFIKLSAVSLVSYFSMKWILQQVDPTHQAKKKAKEKAREQIRKIAAIENAPLVVDKLNEYELMIAAHIVDPDDIKVTWDNIAGLDSLVQELKETVILPIQRRDLFANSLLSSPPKGVLLCGPPGCGKTLIAKATAKGACSRFINLDLSILTDKWYGESQKLAVAVFTLAAKIQPCIIFIDEIDSFLRTRTHNDHEATAMMKAQFMTLWDGLITDSDCSVIIMGATNRPEDLDRAILRRLPATFYVPLPNITQRTQIIRLILETEPISEDVDIAALAKCTEGFSGSDLREMCRHASYYRVRDYVRDHIEIPNKDANDAEDEFHDVLRPIVMDDLKLAFLKMRESKFNCGTLGMPSRSDLD